MQLIRIFGLPPIFSQIISFGNNFFFQIISIQIKSLS